jgi:hypothetical protein
VAHSLEDLAKQIEDFVASKSKKVKIEYVDDPESDEQEEEDDDDDYQIEEED